MKSIKLAILIAISMTTYSMDCTALKRSMSSTGQSIAIQEKLKQAYDFSDDKIHADIRNAYFVFTKVAEEIYNAKITFGPDYTRGISTIATFDQNGKFELNSVEGSTLYKLVCFK